MSNSKPSKESIKGDEMDRLLEQLKREVEEERKKIYQEKYGELCPLEEDELLDFN